MTVSGDFEWDDVKAASNIVDHGVSFEEAAFALHFDHDSIDHEDFNYPERTVSLALNPSTGVLYVVSCEGDEQRTRIISARKAEPHEQRHYEKDGHR